MKFKQLTSLSSPTTIAQLLSVGTLAIGASVGIAATPTHAATITNGQLSFNDGTVNILGTIVPVAGNTFTARFNETGAAIVSKSTGDFASVLPIGARPVVASTVSFSYDPIASNYKSNAPLVFDFNSASGAGTLTIAKDSAFQDTMSALAGHSNFNFLGSSASFTNGATTVIPLTSFNFDVDNIDNTNSLLNPSPNGSYSLVTSVIGAPTSVPEPFTIVGTILGGTAAMRMRKKLAKAAQN